MKNILYHHIKLSEKSNEIKNLYEYQTKNNYFIIGIEITNIDILGYCHINIDKQHNMYSSINITCVEYIWNFQNELFELLNIFDNILIVTLKTDIDSIGGMSLLTNIINRKLKITDNLILRMKAISNSDKHFRLNYNKEYNLISYFKNLNNYNVYGIPNSLFYMTSDLGLDISSKVHNMKLYLLNGDYDTKNNYEDVNRKIKSDIKFDKFKINIIVKNKLSVVEGIHRGAFKVGYKKSDVVIAVNSNYKFGNKIGRKITIGQNNLGFVNMNNVCIELNKIESGFGGSEYIIGSSQEKSSNINLDSVVKIVKNNLVNSN